MDNNKKILIVEDEKMILDALKKKLESSGFEVDMAIDGEEGLRKSLEGDPDLVLLDIILPKMDGMTMLDKLRNEEKGKDIPVIILTNLDADTEFEESREKGVNDYLIKTNWTLDDVVKKIRERLENPS